MQDKKVHGMMPDIEPLSDYDKEQIPNLLEEPPTVSSSSLATGYIAPCPFCGGKAEYNYTDDGGKYIECTKCGVATRLHYDRAENLDSSWNTRHELGGTCCSKCTVPESRCPRLNG